MVIKNKNFLLVFAILFSTIILSSCGMNPEESGNLVPKTVMEDASLPAETHNGIRLHLEIKNSGSSDLVIFVHGGPGFDYRALLPMASIVDGQNKIVFYDQRGSGLSQRVDTGSLSMDAHVADLKSIFETHKGSASNKILIGHSWGGALMQAYIKKYPSDFNKLMFLSSMPSDDTVMNKVADHYPSLYGNDFASYLAQRNAIGEGSHAELDFKYINFQPIQKFYYCNDNDYKKVPFWRFGYVALFKTLESLLSAPISGATMDYDYNFSSSNAAYSGAVYILYGTCDEALGKSASENLYNTFTGASQKQLIAVSNGGHYFWLFNSADITSTFSGATGP